MPQYYDNEFKKKIVRLKLEEGRTAKSIISEYGVSKVRFTGLSGRHSVLERPLSGAKRPPLFS